MTNPDIRQVARRPDARHSVVSVSDMVAEVVNVAQHETVSLRDVISRIGDASFAPILLLPALAVATPLSGVPLFSSLMGIVICLVAMQMLLRRDHIWLPGWVLRRQLKGSVVRAAFQRLDPVAQWIDAKTDRRLSIFVRRPVVIIPQLLCVLSGAVMPILEFIPFSSSMMGAGVALLALGMLTRDGAVMLLGLIPYGVVGWLITSATTS